MTTRTGLVAVLSTFVLVLFLYSAAFRPSGSHSPEPFTTSIPTGSVQDIRNRTLGFQKVFALGGRYDKHDAVTIASSLSEFDVSWADGVKFEDVPKKAIAETWDFSKELNSTYAAWRAHMNLLQHIVDNRIATALIFEDDSDWDWFLKDQLEGFAESARVLQGTVDESGGPYGDLWDLLWLGHCRLGPGYVEQEIHFLENDFTVPPVRVRHALWKHNRVLRENMSNSTRAVFQAHAGMCTFAYAITYEGAQKIITSLSLQADNVPFDVAMSAMCRGKHLTPFPCYGTYPPLFSSHKFAGSRSRESEIRVFDSKRMHPEYTWDIVYSVIQNAARLLSGEQTLVSQWPEETLYPEVNRDAKIEYRRRVDTIDWGKVPKTTIENVNA